MFANLFNCFYHKWGPNKCFLFIYIFNYLVSLKVFGPWSGLMSHSEKCPAGLAVRLRLEVSGNGPRSC